MFIYNFKAWHVPVSRTEFIKNRKTCGKYRYKLITLLTKV